MTKFTLMTGAAMAALAVPGAAWAQSTGTTEFNRGDIVVTGQRATQVNGTKIPDSPKTKVELTNEFLQHETAGQSVDETINNLPGVSFTNNDPYGASGGTLVIRGFDASRISQTIDGVPLNDTGNYAIYSNQQLDPELIDQVNVILGSTDIDSPSASATGSTVNYTSITPTNDFNARMDASVGDLNMMRVFGLVNTGVFTPWGTKAWFSASNQNYNVVYASRGKIQKDQYNFKVYQPIGGSGDFIAIAGNYNVNRNNQSPDFYIDSFPKNKASRFQNVPVCQIDTPQAGVADTPNSCGTNYIESFNPSDTGTLRVTSSFHLADNLVLTVDPTFWYTKANGGAATYTAFEGTGTGGQLGYVVGANGSANYFFGEDLNGDGDVRDTLTCTTFNANGSCKTYTSYGVKLSAPSQTITHRWLVTSSLRWDVSDNQSLRVSYTHDYGRHRQTAEFGYLDPNGVPQQYFPINNPIVASNGDIVERRNRKSFAIDNQVSGEYRGEFFGDKLTIDAGVRAPFFTRDLNQFCFTTNATGSVSCVAGDDADVAAYAAAHPYAYNATTNTVTGYAPPQSRNFHYNHLLPNAGVTYKFTPATALYFSYSQGLQVPGTDNLYASFYSPVGVQGTVPEVTHNFDAGLRYTTSKVQAQVGPWFTIFDNRLASSYDPELDITTYRNLGTVHKYGVDGSVSVRPIPQLGLYAYGSYLWSDILNNVVTGACTSANVTAKASAGVGTCTAVDQPIYALTAGKRESGAPVYTLGTRVEFDWRSIEIGAEAKRTGKSYLNDQNLPLIYNNVNYGVATPAYTTVNLDARLGLGWAGLSDKTYLQVNVTNVFDAFYINHAGTGIAANNDPFVYISPPRTTSLTLNVQF